MENLELLRKKSSMKRSNTLKSQGEETLENQPPNKNELQRKITWNIETHNEENSNKSDRGSSNTKSNTSLNSSKTVYSDIVNKSKIKLLGRTRGFIFTKITRN